MYIITGFYYLSYNGWWNRFRVLFSTCIKTFCWLWKKN